jgi:arginine/ornithine transport system permease protein
VASIVTIIDLTGAARLVQSRYYAPFEAFITAGACYLLLTWGITLAMRRLERSWFAHLRPRTG